MREQTHRRIGRLLSALQSIDTDAQALRRARIRQWLVLCALFSLARLVLTESIVHIYAPMEAISRPYLVAQVLHGTTILALLGVAWMVYRIGSSARRVDVLEAVGCVMLATKFCLTCLSFPPAWRVDILMLLNLAELMVLRAALVPSSGARTAALTAGTHVPVVGATYLLFRGGELDSIFLPATALTTIAIAYAAMTTLCTALISSTLYRLRREVANAAQLGQYILEERIGSGGMGVVYRARHTLLRRPTAVKLLDAEIAGPEAITRFEREVQSTSQLTSPNTIAIYDYGRTPSRGFYYVMEYLDGIDLDLLVNVDGAQPAGRVIHILRQICVSLAEAHELGLVHRDVKPANVMLCMRGRVPDVVKVLDFGLVKDILHADPSVSTDVQMRGTPLYMAPEVIRGGSDIDGRVDLYALGALAYYLLSGRPVFAGRNTIEILAHHLSTPPPPLDVPGVPPALAALINALLAKDPARRPANADAVIEALGRVEGALWGEADARAWWRGRADVLRAKRDADTAQAPLGLSATLPIDLDTRRPASSDSERLPARVRSILHA